MFKSFLKKTFVLLSLLAIANCYDRDYLIECWDEYTDNEKINLCVRYRHYETMWRDCQFNNLNY